MALCIEGSLFSFCFPIKKKSVLKSCWLLIRGDEGPRLGGPKSVLPTQSWPGDVQRAEADPPKLSALRICSLGFPPHVLVSPDPLGFVVLPQPLAQSGLLSPRHPPRAPGEQQISVSP